MDQGAYRLDIDNSVFGHHHWRLLLPGRLQSLIPLDHRPNLDPDPDSVLQQIRDENLPALVQ